MVDLCPMVKWSGIQMVAWKPDWKTLFMVQNVRYLNGLPSHVTLPFEYQTPTLSDNSDESGIQYSDGYCSSV